MAETGYNGGVPEVSPDAAPPNRYNSNRATPDAFGANVGEGIIDVGKGMQVAGKFFGQVAADNASNDYQDFATKILHGDPNKQTPGPDGTMQPDLGYLGLKGRAALDARPAVMQQLQDRAKEIRDGLQTPEQISQFDNFSRRYRDGAAEKVGSHADTQANTWYAEVNKATGNLSQTEIANNYNDDAVYNHGREDLRTAYVKNAQLSGAQAGTKEGDEVIRQAIQSADQTALTARLNAMAVNEPGRAMAELEKNKAVAGTKYDELASAYRGRADQQIGITAGDKAVMDAAVAKRNAAQPASVSGAAELLRNFEGFKNGAYWDVNHYRAGYGSDTVTTADGSVIPVSDKTVVSQEDADRDLQRRIPEFQNGIKKQIGDEAWGRLSPQAQASLTSVAYNYGYLPPSIESAAISGDDKSLAAAVRARSSDNGGVNADRRNKEADNILGKPMGFASLKADAYKAVMENADLNPAQRQHAIQQINQTYAAAQVAAEQDAKGKKEKNDAIHAQISSDIINGKTDGIIARIANSGLPGPEQQTLYNFAVGAGGVESTAAYGPGYTAAFNRVLAGEDDANRLVNPTDVIKMGPGGTGELTKRGVAEVLSTMNTVKKQPDQAGIATVKARQLKYYEDQFGKDQGFSAPGMPQFKNPKGLALFNHQFVPAFEAAYSDWVGQGKNPMTFLSDSKQIDAIMDRVYPPAQRNADSISADNGGATTPDTTLPPIPEGVESGSWQTLMKDPPKKPDGSPISRAAWAASINLLREHATDPKYLKGFNDKFYLSGYTANDILKKVPIIDKRAATEPAPPAENNPMTATPIPMGIRG